MPPIPLTAPPLGPARIATLRTHLYETSPETHVDLEADHGGTAPELSYDHVTGDLMVAADTV